MVVNEDDSGENRTVTVDITSAPSEVTAGSEVSVEAELASEAGVATNQSIEFLVDGDVVENRSVELRPTDAEYNVSAQSGVALSDDAIYVIDDGTIVGIDRTTGEMISEFDAPEGSRKGLAYGNGSIWFADAASSSFDGEIVELNPETGTVRSRLEGYGYDPYGLAYENGSLWVSEVTGNNVRELNPETGEQRSRFDVRADLNNGPNGLAYRNDTLWVGTARPSELAQFTTDGELLQRTGKHDAGDGGLAADQTALYGPDTDGDLDVLRRFDGADPAGGPQATETFVYQTEATDVPEITAEVVSETSNDTAVVSVRENASFKVDIDESATDTRVLADGNLSLVANVTNVGGSTATQTIEANLENDTETAGVSLGPGTTESIEFRFDQVTAAPGSYTVEVRSEDDTVNLTVDVVQDAFFDVGITSVNDQVVAGDDVGVTATTENIGGVEDTRDVEFSLNDTLIETETVTLAPGEDRELNFTANTTEDDVGTVNVSIDTADEFTREKVTILGPPEFQVEIDENGSDAAVVSGTNATIVANVTNTGETAGTQSIGLDFAEITERKDIQIKPGTTETIEFTLEEVPLAAGTYTANVDSDDDLDSLEIEVVSKPNSEVRTLEFNETVTAGDTLTVTASVENDGGVAATTDLEFSFNDTLVETRENVTLSSNETGEFTVTVPTTETDIGTRNLTVRTGDDDATDSVSVVAPAEFQVETLDTPDVVAEGEAFEVTAGVTNAGGTSATRNTTLFVDDEPVATRNVTLAEGETATVVFDAVSIDDSGESTVEVVTDQDTETSSITVEAPGELALSELDIAGDGSETTVTDGAVKDVTVQVENVGGTETTTEITLRVVDGPTETLSRNESITLAGGDSATVTFEEVTGELGAGAYDVTISSGSDELGGDVTVEGPSKALPESVPGEYPAVNAGALIEGDEGAVAFEVRNELDRTEEFTLGLEIRDSTDSSTVSEATRTIELDADEDGTVTFTKPVSELDAGFYEYEVNFVPREQGTPPTGGFIEVLESEDELTVAAFDGEEARPDPAGPGTGVTVSATALDQRGDPVDAGENVTFEVIDGSGEMSSVDGETGANGRVQATYTPNVSDAGSEVSVRIAAGDPDAGDTLAGADTTVSFDVEEPRFDEIADVTAAPDPAEPGDTVEVTARGIDQFGTDFPGEPVEFEVVQGNQENLNVVRNTTSDNAPLVAEYQTDDADAGSTVTVEITAENADVETTASFAVAEPDPASLSVDIDEDASDSTVTPGENVTVVASVTNDGERTARRNVTLERDGQALTEENVTFPANETTSVSFEYPVGDSEPAGEREVVLAAGDARDSLVVTTQPATENFVVEDVVTPDLVDAGGTLTAESTVRNDGDAAGSQSIELRVGGTVVDTENVTLDPGASRTVTLSATVDATAVRRTA
ncbi:hypothetical protein DJ70_01135, partial [Halorubrum halodurans]